MGAWWGGVWCGWGGGVGGLRDDLVFSFLQLTSVGPKMLPANYSILFCLRTSLTKKSAGGFH